MAYPLPPSLEGDLTLLWPVSHLIGLGLGAGVGGDPILLLLKNF